MAAATLSPARPAAVSTSGVDSTLHRSSIRPTLPRLFQHRASSLRAQSLSSTDSAKALSNDTFSELNEGIAHFYDSSSGVWEDIWGEHMHHGYYDPGLPLQAAFSVNHGDAQVRMIEESLKWAEIPEVDSRPQRIIDVGCGIGGSSRHLARKYGAEVIGITLSPRQAQRATSITSAAGLSSKVSFQVADALNQPFPDSHFDFVWSMESGEHMPDKQKFMAELVRVTRPGGRILIVTWCHRELLAGEESLKPNEEELLKRICDAYYLPAWCPASKYTSLAHSMGLQDVKSDDWTQYITLFWPAVILSAFSFRGISGLFKSGWTTIKGALAMYYMVKGYNSGLIKFALITARKPILES
ncbi:hypothetical protein KP509_12G044000 [Ceratopteris richardii]|uniref:Methyltransferase type 11 domain-containing protein n=1 Tax=Ceratopteris richardii TaxID=49495 RepID=A0A8T2TIN5_CERRI|nr:hypothetical protein KP509_12G044000 [Ceratopteris richardii]